MLLASFGEPQNTALFVFIRHSTLSHAIADIGFTVNPKRRIRQHNRVIQGGAKRTGRFAPWEMVCLVYGFPSKVTALQFEWAWQRKNSRHTNASLRSMKLKRGYQGAIQFLAYLLSIPPWSRLPLTINFFCDATYRTAIGPKSCLSNLPPWLQMSNLAIDNIPIREATTTENSDCSDCDEDDDDDYNDDDQALLGADDDEDESLGADEDFMDFTVPPPLEISSSALQPQQPSDPPQQLAHRSRSTSTPQPTTLSVRDSLPTDRFCRLCVQPFSLESLNQQPLLQCPHCQTRYHPRCLGSRFFPPDPDRSAESSDLMARVNSTFSIGLVPPILSSTCPQCDRILHWPLLVGAAVKSHYSQIRSTYQLYHGDESRVKRRRRSPDQKAPTRRTSTKKSTAKKSSSKSASSSTLSSSHQLSQQASDSPLRSSQQDILIDLY